MDQRDQYWLHSRRDFLAATAGGLVLGVVSPGIAGECKTTSPAVEGPFWRAGAPVTTNIRTGLPGETLIVRGQLRGGPKCLPVKGAILDVWQADAVGKYDVDYGTSRAFLRGRIATDNSGFYQFETIRPAQYVVMGRTRPAHIHFKILASGHPELVTQLYFADDPNLESDPLRAVRPDLVVTPEKRGDSLDCKFDITLRG